ncbi:AMP-binding protein [Sporichthya sp.]|uniref:AMP-binding protein n=1 Tax=Sporichthya sp. TaxID=65475 RepID=UPI0017A493D3|nr:AMP-binding protein [Sporichthya sp.]MBA3743880.1 AMP-binding protein [Sporichthya sp.]
MYLTQPVHRSLQTKPDEIATICGDCQFTFAAQADRVARLAGGLVGLGVAPGDRVAYLGLNSDRYLQYYLAVPWADAVVVPRPDGGVQGAAHRRIRRHPAREPGRKGVEA